jgi:hypothetical protein
MICGISLEFPGEKLPPAVFTFNDIFRHHWLLWAALHGRVKNYSLGVSIHTRRRGI